MHFLMPNVFQSHSEFKEWFSNPLTGMIEGSQEYNENLVRRLHKVCKTFADIMIKSVNYVLTKDEYLAFEYVWGGQFFFFQLSIDLDQDI